MPFFHNFLIIFIDTGIIIASTLMRHQIIPKGMVIFMVLDRIALILVIIGALNWGSIGLFQFDIVAWICGGPAAVVSRIVYTLVALGGLWCISLLFRSREPEYNAH